MKWVWNLERRHKRYTKMQWQVWRASPPELHAFSVHLCSIFQVSERFFCALRHPKHALKPSQPPPELLHVSDSSHRRLLYVPLTAELWFQCLSRGLRWQSDWGPELCCSWFHRESRPTLTLAHTWVYLGACTNTGYTHLDRSLTSVIVQYFSVPRLKGPLCRNWNTKEHTHPHRGPPLSACLSALSIALPLLVKDEEAFCGLDVRSLSQHGWQREQPWGRRDGSRLRARWKGCGQTCPACLTGLGSRWRWVVGGGGH